MQGRPRLLHAVLRGGDPEGAGEGDGGGGLEGAEGAVEGGQGCGGPERVEGLADEEVRWGEGRV